MTVTLDYDTLVEGIGAAALSSGTRISAGEARRLACNAAVIPAVFDGNSDCLDLGRSRPGEGARFAADDLLGPDSKHQAAVVNAAVASKSISRHTLGTTSSSTPHRGAVM
jgi:hypothetical protein